MAGRTPKSTNTKIFVLAGLMVGLALALLVSPFASSDPDGLEKVAADKGFEESATDHHLADSPLADYGVDGVDNDQLSTGVSGVIGVALTFGVGLVLFGLLRVLRPDDPEVSGEASSRSDTHAGV